MRGIGLGLVVLLGVSVGAAGQAAAGGCPCPKAKNAELYGTVSMFPPQLPGPRIRQPVAKPARVQVSTTAVPTMADVARDLPTPALDRIGNPLLWDPVFVQQ